jgi:hypothetical protein
MGWRLVLLKSGLVARGREEKWVGVGVSEWRREKEERGGGLSTTVSSVGRPATALDHQARVASLPHERGRANVADERDRGEAGPGGSGQGAREKERMRQGGSGPPTCGPRRHSVERCDSNRI